MDLPCFCFRKVAAGPPQSLLSILSFTRTVWGRVGRWGRKARTFSLRLFYAGIRQSSGFTILYSEGGVLSFWQQGQTVGLPYTPGARVSFANVPQSMTGFLSMCIMIARDVRSFFLLLAVVAVVGCEYEFKEDSGGSSVVLLHDVARESSDPRAPEQAEPKKPVQPPEVRPVLAPGKDVSGQAALPPKVKRMNLAALVEQGALTVTSNVPGAGDIQQAFDESDSTLSKSEGTNPFIFTLQFTSPVTVKAVKVLSTYSDYAWAVELQGAPRLVVDMIIDGEWSTIAWPEGVKTSQVKIEVLRKTRDNFVHLNEIELYE